MIDFDSLNLPITKVQVTGPAVDALSARKEANDHPRVNINDFRNSYAAVKPTVITGLKELGAAKF